MPTQADAPAFGVATQLSAGTIHWPLTSVTAAPLEGTTYPDQFVLCDQEVGGGGACCVRVTVEDADWPAAFAAVNVNVHCSAVLLAGTVTAVVPLQVADCGSLPASSAGVDESEHDDASVDE
jgi:hypothetical protein